VNKDEYNDVGIVIEATIDRVSVCYELKKIKFMKLTEFQKCPLNFSLKFSTLTLTEKLQSHFFTVSETLNSDKSD